MVTFKDAITLPNGAKYEDLHKAHEDGHDQEGRTEEELYPRSQAVKDNYVHYMNAIEELGSMDILDFKKKRFDAGEVEERLGNDSEEMKKIRSQLAEKVSGYQKEFEEYFKVAIQQVSLFSDLKVIENNISFCERMGMITKAQKDILQVLLLERKLEYQKEVTSYINERITSEVKDSVDVKNMQKEIDLTHSVHMITDAQRDFLRECLVEREKELS